MFKELKSLVYQYRDDKENEVKLLKENQDNFREEIEKNKLDYEKIIDDAAQKIEEFIQKANKSNLLVHVWTINDRKTINNLIDLGVNGIVTDEPELLMEIMKERNLISN